MKKIPNSPLTVIITKCYNMCVETEEGSPSRLIQ